MRDGDRRVRPRRGLTPVWRKAPFVLLRYPGLLAALAVGALLLSMAVASYSLFVSASASTLVQAEVDRPLVTRYGAGVAYKSTGLPFSEPAPNDPATPLHVARGDAFARLASESPMLDEAVSGILGPVVSLATPERPARSRAVRLFAGTGAVAHVEVLSGHDGPGVWVPEVVSRGLEVGPGDRIQLLGSDPPASLPVDGVYRSLYTEPRRGYWLQWAGDIYPSSRFCPPGCREPPPPPQFLLMDADQLMSASQAVGQTSATFGWQAPLRADLRLTLEGAEELAGFAGEMRAVITDAGTDLGELLDCCHPREFTSARTGGETTFRSQIESVIRETEERLAAIEGPGRLLQVAGIVVSVAVLAAAGAFAHVARRTEAGLLFARGVSPAAVGARAALEGVIPSLLGASVGLGVALLLARTLVPEGPPAGEAIRSAALGAAAAVAGSLVAIGLVSAVAFVAQHHRARLGVLGRFPWEVALLGMALLSFQRLGAGGALVTDSALGVRRPSVFLLLFPIAFIGGFAALGARALREGFRRVRDREGNLPSAAYLAVHRVSAAPGLTIALVAAAGMTLGTFVQARMLEQSLEATVEAKAGVFVGSDVQAWVPSDTTVPPDFPLPVTKVTRLAHAGRADPGGSFDLLAVDPATLPRAAFWRDAFSDRPLEDLAAALDARQMGSLPVVVAGTEAPSPVALEMNERRVPVRVVGRAEAFPGMLAGRLLVVADADALEGFYAAGADPLTTSNARTELWIRGEPGEAVAAVNRLDTRAFGILTAERTEDIPYIAAVADTFVALNALGLGAGVLVVAALLMYLEARQRSQAVAHGLSLRMGMTPAGHRRSLAIELGSTLLVSFGMAVILAVAAVLLMVPYLDPLARIPPDLLLVAPVASIAGAFLVLGAAVWAGAWGAERRARAIPLGELMRVAE
jgi:putative ABC transport system permease protein